MPIAKLDKQQVTGALKATGSKDPDILYSKKEEMLIETKRMKHLAVFLFIVGIGTSITIIGAVLGIPVICFGVWVRKRVKHNVTTADDALSEYLRSIAIQARAASA